MAQTKAPVEIDLSKIKPAVNMQNAVSTGISGMMSGIMPGMTGNGSQAPAKTTGSKTASKAPVEIDLSKIKPAVNMQNAVSTGISGMMSGIMPGMTGNGSQAPA
ncbi:MAG: hypothetical protein D3904_17265, partial [Candidatus Electrothrix sp. EH2]|nr:hypothetical protein [Candidatus Electrothrix sp. EH2]